MGKKIVLGLDWGTSHVKGVISKHANGVVEILDFFNIKNTKPEETLKSLEEKIKVKFSQCVTNLSGKNVLIRYIQLPAMPDDETKAVINMDYTKHLPFDDKDEVYLDFQRIFYPKTISEKKVQELPNIILIGIKKQIIEEALSKLEKSKFYADIIDCDVFATGNVFTFFTLSGEDKVIAVINIGYSKTTVNILIGPYSIFSREFYTAGEQIIEGISKKLVCDMQTAQNAKEIFKEEDRKAILEGMAKIIQDIANEIELSFDYFETRFEKNIEEVYLSGGEVYHKEIRELFAEKIGKKLSNINVTDKLVISGELKEKFKKDLPLYLLALGLSLRTD